MTSSLSGRPLPLRAVTVVVAVAAVPAEVVAEGAAVTEAGTMAKAMAAWTVHGAASVTEGVGGPETVASGRERAVVATEVTAGILAVIVHQAASVVAAAGRPATAVPG